MLGIIISLEVIENIWEDVVGYMQILHHSTYKELEYAQILESTKVLKPILQGYQGMTVFSISGQQVSPEVVTP